MIDGEQTIFPVAFDNPVHTIFRIHIFQPAMIKNWFFGEQEVGMSVRGGHLAAREDRDRFIMRPVSGENIVVRSDKEIKLLALSTGQVLLSRHAAITIDRVRVEITFVPSRPHFIVRSGQVNGTFTGYSVWDHPYFFPRFIVDCHLGRSGFMWLHFNLHFPQARGNGPRD